MQPLCRAMLRLHVSVLAAATLVCSAWAQAPPKVIIMCLSDDQGHYNIGWTNPETKTPFMNDLLKNGIRLNRHYTYQFCSPTRASLLTGRLPPFVNQFNNAKWGWTLPAMHPGMTTLAHKMSGLGYHSMQVMKWHEGLAHQNYTPVGRGFHQSLGYLSGGEQHYTQITQRHTDIYNSTAPARGANGTWNAALAVQSVTSALQALAQGRLPANRNKLFVYLALQDTHEPVEAPDRLVDQYPEDWVQGRRVYSGMASAVDETLRNITGAAQSLGLWEDTLLVFGSDNGGPSLVGGPSNANNYPLRGGKGNDFEGGVRTVAMVTGGAVPQDARGTAYDGTIHVSDWYRTLCQRGGGTPGYCGDNTTARGLPPSTSLDMWGSMTQGTESPRRELLLSYRNFDAATGACRPGNESSLAAPSGPSQRTGHYTVWSRSTAGGMPMDPDEPPPAAPAAAAAAAGEEEGGLTQTQGATGLFDGAFIQGDMKWVQGTQSGSGYWWSPNYPNSTAKLPFDAPGCPLGCLFNVTADPAEYVDLKEQLPEVADRLQRRFHALGRHCFQSDAGGSADLPGALAKVNETGGYWAPWMD